jgi:hypothetical protein
VLWDLATGKRLKQWSLQEQIGFATFASDNRHLGVSLGTGVIYVFRLAPLAAEGK